MSQTSAIEWTDATWNPVRGCVKVSPGCAHCYAETFAERWRGVAGHPYEQGFDLRLVPEKLDEPLRWTKPRRVFVNSMSDLFQDGVPDAYIDQVFAVMASAQRHTFQVLTKRADRMRAYLNDPLRWASIADQWTRTVPRAANRHTIPPLPLLNVWLGVSVENQHFADERIPLLLQTPAAVRFISAEPLLGPIDLTKLPLPGHPADFDALSCYDDERDEPLFRGAMLDWVIVGGESGPGARPFDLAWARSIVAQCRAAGVPVFVKQLGAKPIADASDYVACNASGFPLEDARPIGNGRLLLSSRKGGDMSEWPADLRVREFPQAVNSPPSADASDALVTARGR